jgi:hypothetical protein
MDADVEAVSLLVAMEGGYHGHDGIRRWWGNMLDVFPDWAVDVVEVRDFGDLTLSTVVNRGHGAGSDAPLEQRIWLLAEWHDKKVVWWRAYGSEAEAFEAVGLAWRGRRCRRRPHDGRCPSHRPMKWWRLGRVVHFEAVDVLAPRVRQETGRGAHGTPNCCYEHAEQNL